MNRYEFLTNINDITKEELLFLVGMCDSEGSFMLRYPYQYCYPNIQVNNTDLDFVSYISSIFCSKIALQYDDRKKQYKDVYRTQLNGQRAVEIYIKLYPYLSNRRQAKIREILFHPKIKERYEVLYDELTDKKFELPTTSWLAGWWIGDGFISQNGQGVVAGIQITDLDIIETIVKKYPAKVFLSEKIKTHKQKYRVSYYGQMARDFLYDIYPYLSDRFRTKAQKILTNDTNNNPPKGFSFSNDKNYLSNGSSLITQLLSFATIKPPRTTKISWHERG